MLLAYGLFILTFPPPKKKNKSVLKPEFYIFLDWRNLIVLCEGYELWIYDDLVRQVPHVIYGDLVRQVPHVIYGDHVRQVPHVIYGDLVRQVPHVIFKGPSPVSAYSEKVQRVGKMNSSASY